MINNAKTTSLTSKNSKKIKEIQDLETKLATENTELNKLKHEITDKSIRIIEDNNITGALYSHLKREITIDNTETNEIVLETPVILNNEQLDKIKELLGLNNYSVSIYTNGNSYNDRGIRIRFFNYKGVKNND